MFPQTNKSWNDFKTHFTKHDKDHKEQGTTRDAGYHDVNFIERGNQKNGQDSDFVALTEAITVQTSANSANFTRMMNLFTQQMANVAQGGIERNSRPQSGERPKFYCWTHGRGFNTTHTSDTCNTRADGHKEEAT